MVRLILSHEIKIRPVPPYNFSLTVRNPAGWSFFTPFEVFDNGILWTSAFIGKTLVGFRLSSSGDVSKPEIHAAVYTEEKLPGKDLERIRRALMTALGSEQDLSLFYRMGMEDEILKFAIEDLYGMHDRFPASVFPEAVLAILLQMAPLKRSNEMMSSFIINYGENAEFDGRSILAWPLPESIMEVTEKELSEKCKVGYRAKYIIRVARILAERNFPPMEELLEMSALDAKKKLVSLPGIGDYSADIINPHGGFPIDVWSAEVFGKLFFGKKPENNREAVKHVKSEGVRRWGKWAWMAFFYIVQDLPGLSEKLGVNLRLT